MTPMLSTTTVNEMADHHHDRILPMHEKEIPSGATSVNGLDIHQFHPQQNYSHMGQGFATPDGYPVHPSFYKPYEHRKFGNPAPLGLSAFALSTFVLSCINLHARGETKPNIAIPLAFAYGGLVQLLAGMWEMAVGNTFGATALSSYGGFWIAYGILLSPTWNILGADGPYEGETGSVMGFFLTGWFIFSAILFLCTLKSTVMFSVMFFFVTLCFLMLSCENYAHDMHNEVAKIALQKAGGTFGMFAAFLAWYNALAGIQDSSNSFFQVPVFHLPWSDKGIEMRKQKTERSLA